MVQNVTVHSLEVMMNFTAKTSGWWVTNMTVSLKADIGTCNNVL